MHCQKSSSNLETLKDTYVTGSDQGILLLKVPISFPKLRSPWPAVGERELWEHPFQACAIDTIDADSALRSEAGCAEFGYFLCYFKLDAPRALLFQPLVKRNEALGLRLPKMQQNLHSTHQTFQSSSVIWNCLAYFPLMLEKQGHPHMKHAFHNLRWRRV